MIRRTEGTLCLEAIQCRRAVAGDVLSFGKTLLKHSMINRCFSGISGWLYGPVFSCLYGSTLYRGRAGFSGTAVEGMKNRAHLSCNKAMGASIGSDGYW